jgi:ankyrin repeat protein
MPRESLLLDDRSGRTAFHIAAESRRCISLGLIVDTFGEMPMVQDSHGNTPLHYAVKHGKLTGIFTSSVMLGV